MEINNANDLRKRLEEILEEESSVVGQLAIDNQFVGFADGVVQLDLDNDELFGCTFTQGTEENPENLFIEIYRLSERFNPSDICSDCNGCTLLEGETEEEVFEECLLEAIEEDFNNYFDERTILDCLEIGEMKLEKIFGGK